MFYSSTFNKKLDLLKNNNFFNKPNLKKNIDKNPKKFRQ